MKNQQFTFSVAPMMEWTDRHCRAFHRMLSVKALLYTEMVVADAVIHGDRDYLIGFDRGEHPVALQIGGCDPQKLAQASAIGAEFGYDEINLNVGCPSDRVKAGRFGASLMADPDLVAACFSAMQEASSVPVTVKCRIGIDDQICEQTLPQFIETVSAAGCEHFIVHARPAWLEGLSPKDNRTIPPLDYDLVRRMKVQFPSLEIVLNGGLETVEKAASEAADLDGVMFGRAAYHQPWVLTTVDEVFYGQPKVQMDRDDIVRRLIEYAVAHEQELRSTKALIRHIMGLYHGQAGARVWRRSLSESHDVALVSKRIEMAFEQLCAARDSVISNAL